MYGLLSIPIISLLCFTSISNAAVALKPRDAQISNNNDSNNNDSANYSKLSISKQLNIPTIQANEQTKSRSAINSNLFDKRNEVKYSNYIRDNVPSSDSTDDGQSDLWKLKFKNDLKVALSKRQVSIDAINSKGYLYFANITLGTPPQVLSLQIDTGSSDAWVESPNSPICSSAGDKCAITGTYDNTTSSTYKYVSSDFSIRYVDQTGAVGDYATETMGIGGIQLKAQQFGYGVEATSSEGILGIGYSSNEAILQFGGKQYLNVPEQLKAQGFTKINAYSLWLDDLAAASGTVLFGAIDSAKFQGKLYRIPLDYARGGPIRTFTVTLSSIGVTPPGAGSSNTVTSGNTAVVLDSGSSFCSLPPSFVKAIAAGVSAVYDSELEVFYRACPSSTNDGTVNFVFGSLTINVPYAEILVPLTYTDGTAAKFRNGTAVCTLGIVPAKSSSAVILGDSMLRSAYIVYDLDNNVISMAQTNFNPGSSDIQQLTSAGVTGAEDSGVEVITSAVPDFSRTAAPTASITHGGFGGLFTNSASSRMSSSLPAIVCVVSIILISHLR